MGAWAGVALFGLACLCDCELNVEECEMAQIRKPGPPVTEVIGAEPGRRFNRPVARPPRQENLPSPGPVTTVPGSANNASRTSVPNRRNPK